MADPANFPAAQNPPTAAEGFHDIKPLPEFYPFNATRWSGIAAIVVGALLLWWLFNLRERRKAAVPESLPPLPPYAAALEEFRRLELLRKSQRIAVRDLASGISVAIRLYLERCFRFPAGEMTVYEVCAEFPSLLKHRLPALPRERISELVAELRGRLKFCERAAFADDSGEVFHLASPELLATIESSLKLLKILAEMLEKEEIRSRSVMYSAPASPAAKLEA